MWFQPGCCQRVEAVEQVGLREEAGARLGGVWHGAGEKAAAT